MPAAVIFLRKKANMGAGKANPRSILIELQVEDIHGLDSQFYFQVKKKYLNKNLGIWRKSVSQ